MSILPSLPGGLKRGFWLLYLAMAVGAPLVIHNDIIDRPWLSADDYQYSVQSSLASQNLSSLLAPVYHSSRPVADTVFWLIYETIGQDATTFHAAVLLGHGLVTAALACLCRLVGLHPLTSALAGVLYLVSPSHFRNVQVIAALSYHVALFLGIVATMAYVAWGTRRRLFMAVAFQFLTPLAVLAHPAAFFVIPFLAIREWLLERPWRSRIVLLPATATSVVCVALLVLLFPHSVQTYHSTSSISAERMVLQLLTLLGRLADTAFWLPMSVWEPHAWEPILGIIVLAGLGALAWARRRSAVWAIWTLLALVPFLTRLPRSLQYDPAALTPTGPSHYVHMAAVGMAVLVAIGIEKLFSWSGRRRVILIPLSMTALIVLTSLVAHRDLHAFAFFSAGRYLTEAGRPRQAQTELRTALTTIDDDRAISREYAVYWLVRNQLQSGDDALGIIGEWRRLLPESALLPALHHAILSVNGDSHASHEEAARVLAILQDEEIHAESMRAAIVRVYDDLANRAAADGDSPRVERAYRYQGAFSDDPDYPMIGLAVAQMELRDLEEASKTLRTLLQHSPDHATAHYNLGAVYLMTGHIDSAVTELRTSLDYSAEPLTKYQLARALKQNGALVEAHELILEVLPPDGIVSERRLEVEAAFGGLEVREMVRAFDLLGQVRDELGYPASAVDAYRAALALEPQSVDTQERLALSLKLSSQAELAAEAMDRLREMEAMEAEEDDSP